MIFAVVIVIIVFKPSGCSRYAGSARRSLSVLLLDEPTEGIQPNIVEEIEEIILRLNREQGLTIILVEQNIPFARKIGDVFIMLEKGCVAASGKQEDLSDDLIHRHLAV